MSSISQFVRKLSVRKTKKNPKKTDEKAVTKDHRPTAVTATLYNASAYNTASTQAVAEECRAELSSSDTRDLKTVKHAESRPTLANTSEPQEEWMYKNIVLHRGGKGLGFNIGGGTDKSASADERNRAIFVTKITEGGVAAENGLLRVNDIIVSVNGVSYDGLTHGEGVAILKAATSPVNLAIKRCKLQIREDSVISIDIVKTGKGLGFSVAGGTDDQYREGDDGIYVTKIAEGGSAQKDNRLAVGDKLLSVDNLSLAKVKHDEAISMLKNTGQKVSLLVAKHRMDDVAKPKETLSCEILAVTPTANESENSTNWVQLIPEVTAAKKQMPYHIQEPRQIVLKKRIPGGLGFNIVGGKDGAGVFVSSILAGSAADENGELRTGDQLLAVNDVDLRSATHEEAAATLKAVCETAIITAHYRIEEFNRLEQKIREWHALAALEKGAEMRLPILQKTAFIRTLLDYDTTLENFSIHGKRLSFTFGNILHVVIPQDGSEWWQARRVQPLSDVEQHSGLIPSKIQIEARERSRITMLKMEPISSDTKEIVLKDKNRMSFILSKKLPFNGNILNARTKKEHAVDSELDSSSVKSGKNKIYSVFCYQPVVQLQCKYTRPVILYGPLKDKISNTLITEFPEKYSSCVPHTTRPMRRGETDGINYHFVTNRKQMEQDIESNLFVEAGLYGGHLYGMSTDSILQVAKMEKRCILDVSINAVNRLNAAELYPITILIKPSSPAVVNMLNAPLSEDMARQIYDAAGKLFEESKHHLIGVASGHTESEIYGEVLQIINENAQGLIWVTSNDESQLQ